MDRIGQWTKSCISLWRIILVQGWVGTEICRKALLFHTRLSTTLAFFLASLQSVSSGWCWRRQGRGQNSFHLVNAVAEAISAKAKSGLTCCCSQLHLHREGSWSQPLSYTHIKLHVMAVRSTLLSLQILLPTDFSMISKTLLLLLRKKFAFLQEELPAQENVWLLLHPGPNKKIKK